MSTTTAAQLFQFRCNHCWNTNLADVEVAGTLISCQCCGEEINAPEATPERIKLAETDDSPAPIVQLEDEPELSEKEMRTMVREQLDGAGAGDSAALKAMPDAHCLVRLIAQFVDGMCFALSLAIGIGLLALLGHFQIIDLSGYGADQGLSFDILMAVAFAWFPALVLLLVQWNMTATQGKTIGKYLCCVRVVTLEGNPPGFIFGVVVRNWVRVLFSLVPFLPLIDSCLIFYDNRCLHDYIAATRVVTD